MVLRANLNLPGLQEVPAAKVDVELLLYPDCDSEPHPLAELVWVKEPTAQVWKANTSAGLYRKLGYIAEEGSVRFILNPAGTTLWIAWKGMATVQDVSTLLSGPVQSCLLRLRGHTLLHSSVVAIDGHALAMIGSVRAGKSTTALALLNLGATVLSDDVAALVEHREKFDVRPCDPRLRLGEDSASMFGSYQDLEPLWSPGANRPQKRSLATAQPHQAPTDDVPLAAVYVLEPRDASLSATSIQPAQPTEAIVKLMTNRFTAYTLERPEIARDFSCLCRLAASTPVRIVRRPDSLATLPALSEAIRSDFRALL